MRLLFSAVAPKPVLTLRRSYISLDRVGQIMVSNSRASNAERHNPDWDKLVSLGIPATAITEFGNASANTYDEARSLAHWAKHRVQRIIVPMEIFPSWRVQWDLASSTRCGRSSSDDRDVGAAELRSQ